MKSSFDRQPVGSVYRHSNGGVAGRQIGRCPVRRSALLCLAGVSFVLAALGQKAARAADTQQPPPLAADPESVLNRWGLTDSFGEDLDAMWLRANPLEQLFARRPHRAGALDDGGTVDEKSTAAYQVSGDEEAVEVFDPNWMTGIGSAVFTGISKDWTAISAASTAGIAVWDGRGADNNWATAANWLGNTAPVAFDTLVFDGNIRLTPNNDLPANTRFDGLSFATSAGSFTVGGNSIVLGGNITDSSLNAQSVGNALSLSLAPTIHVSHFDGSLTLAGAISGNHGLTKTGPGLLVLSNAGNTYTGTIWVTGGTLSIGADAHLGNASNAIVLDGGTLRASTSINATHAITVGNAGGGTGTLDASAALPYGGVISGASATSGLTKTGAQRVTLFGDNAYTGATTVNQGELFLDFGSAAPGVSSIIESGSSLVLGGYSTSLGAPSAALNAPALIFNGRSNVASTQTFSGLTLDAGNSSVVTRSVGTGVATLALGAITHNPGGVVSFVRFKDAAGSVDGRFTTSTANTNGILGGWAVTHPSAVTGITFSTPATDWAANDGNGNIVAYTGYTRAGIASGYGTTTAPTIANDATRNLRIDSGSRILLTSGSTTANTNTITVASTAGLVVGSGVTGSGIGGGAIVTAILSSTQFTVSDRSSMTTSGQTFVAAPLTSLLASGITDVNTIQATDERARVIGIGSGNTLRLGAYGGIWNSYSGNKPLVIGVSGASAGTLTAGGAANTPGEIVFNANAFTTATVGITVNSVIADNGTGAVSITKTGTGGMSVDQANSYTGNTYINQGQLSGNNARSFGGDGTTAGSGTVFVQPGAQATLSGVVTYANNFVIAGSGFNVAAPNGAVFMWGSATLGTAASTITLAGDARIGGRQFITLVHNIAGKMTGDYNLELTGDNGSTFLLTNPGNDMGGHIGVNAVNLSAGRTPAVYENRAIHLRLGASEVIPNGAGKGNLFIGGGTSTGVNSTLDLNGFNETINGLVSVGTAAQTRVTSGVAGTATLTLGDGDATATFGGIIQNGSGTVALTKIGGGTQTLTGLNTYTGATTINGGTLEIRNDGSATTAGRLTGSAAADSIQVNQGGTLLLSGAGNNSRIDNAAGVALNGGTLSTAGGVDLVEGNSGADNGDGFGALTLLANSFLDFGVGEQATLVADSFSPGAFTLTALNWSGTFNALGTDGLSDRLIFDNDPGAAAARNVLFYDGSGSFLGTGGALALGNGLYEIVPTAVPEPSTWAAGILTIAAVGWTQRNRLRRLGHTRSRCA